jgi:hypothetical protein
VALVRLKTAGPRITETKLANPERIVIDVRRGTTAARAPAAARKPQAARAPRVAAAPKPTPAPEPAPKRAAPPAPALREGAGVETPAPPADSMFEPGPPAPLLEDQIAESEAWKPPVEGKAESRSKSTSPLPPTSAPPPSEATAQPAPQAPPTGEAEAPLPASELGSEELEPGETDTGGPGGLPGALLANRGVVALTALIMILAGVWLLLRRRRAAQPTRDAYPRLPPLDEITAEEESFAGAEREEEIDAGLPPAPPYVEVADEAIAAVEAGRFEEKEEEWPEIVPHEEAGFRPPPPGPLFEAPVRPSAAAAVVPPVASALTGAPQGQQLATDLESAGPTEITRLLQEIERRLRHLEVRIEELADGGERIDRQLGSQGEELRVQRAAIARAQRVLRALSRPDDVPEPTAKATPPARGPGF